MKKPLLLTALLIGTIGATQAQITLTAATHMPSPGMAYYTAFGDTSVNPVMPAVGANKTWNYSNVLQVGQDTAQYFSCTPQANCASFGNANLLMGSAADTFYQYFKTGTSMLQTTGGSTPQFTVKLSNPLDMYRYPFTYNSQFADTGRGTATTSIVPVPLTVVVTDSVKGTGYGTVITPEGTFQNVLQVRSTLHTKATALTQTVLETRMVQYEWYSDTSRFPVMTLSFNYSTDGSGQTTFEGVSGTYRTATPTAVETARAAEAFQLVPNPSTGMTRLEIPHTFSANATVLITDISGKMVFKQTTGTQSVIDINTADWAQGIYLVRLQSASGEALMQKLSVQ